MRSNDFCHLISHGNYHIHTEHTDTPYICQSDKTIHSRHTTYKYKSDFSTQTNSEIQWWRWRWCDTALFKPINFNLKMCFKTNHVHMKTKQLIYKRTTNFLILLFSPSVELNVLYDLCVWDNVNDIQRIQVLFKWLIVYFGFMQSNKNIFFFRSIFFITTNKFSIHLHLDTLEFTLSL